MLEKLLRYLIIRGSIALVSGASKQIIGPGEMLGLSKGTLSQLGEHHWDFCLFKKSFGRFEVAISVFFVGWLLGDSFAACHRKEKTQLGGGFKYFFIFTPTWEMIQFDL